MSAGQQIPPWLQEQLMKMQQTQQNLQSVMAQKQQIVMEIAESDKALEELKKVEIEIGNLIREKKPDFHKNLICFNICSAFINDLIRTIYND